MSVVVNCRFLTRPTTGVERFAEGLITELADLRDDLVLLAPRAGNLRRDELGGLPVERRGTLSGHAWEQASLRRELRRRGRPLLVSLANTGPVGYRRQLVAIHDVTHRRHPHGYSWPFRTLYAVMTPRLVRASAGVVTVSDFSRRELVALYSPTAPITVVPNAVGEWVTRGGSAPSDPPLREPFFLVVGSPNAHKNLATAYHAFRDYRARGGRSRLVVVGSSHRSFATMDVEGAEGATALGRVSDDTLGWLYAHARAFIFPSLYEGFGIPPLEAQAAGTPVIASDIGAVREALQPASALWFSPTDPLALADAMDRMDADAGLRARLVRAGARNVTRFSWRRSAELLSRAIDEADAAGTL